MDIAAFVAPQVARPQPPISSAAQYALSPTIQTAQQATMVTRTQTMQAPQATGRGESPRESRSGTDGGTYTDTRASTANARTNRAGYGAQHRGANIDVRV